MRKTEIELGVEYAETGPMAYGREPSVTPKRVRFTSLESGEWVMLAEMVVVAARGPRVLGIPNGLNWETDAATRRIVRLSEVPPEAKRNGRIGASAKEEGEGARRWVASQPERGVLPAELYDPNIGSWRPYLALPAAIHRPWAEYAKTLDAKAQKEQNYRLESKVEEISALLHRLGLDDLIYADQSLGMIKIREAQHNGPKFLEALQAWALEHGLQEVTA